MRDILIEAGDLMFSYRVAGILIREGKILLQKPENDNYSLIGGHITYLETAAEALKREFQEELKVQIKIDRLLAVGEVFFPWKNKNCHQVALYYTINLMNESEIPHEGVFQGKEAGDENGDMDFCWLPLEKLYDEIVYPKELMPIILKNGKNTEHFVSRQI